MIIGILKRATDAKVNSDETQIKERIQLAYHSALIKDLTGENGELTNTTLQEELDKEFVGQTVTLNPSEDKKEWIISVDNIDVVVKAGKDTTPKWVYNHTTQEVTNGKDTLKIGDRIKGYESPAETTYTGDWRVLGEEEGKLLIVTETAYAPYPGLTAQVGPEQYGLRIAGNNTQVADAYGIDGGIAKLNEIGAAYENTKYANVGSGRSINLDDINRITGYDPENCYQNPNDLTQMGPCYQGTYQQYGNKVTYTLKSDGKVWYKGVSPVETTETKIDYYTKFIPYQGTEIATGTSYTLEKSTGFEYYIDTLGKFQKSAIPVTNQVNAAGIQSGLPAYDMIITGDLIGMPYFLATSYTHASYQGVAWGLCLVYKTGLIYGFHRDGNWMWTSETGNQVYFSGIRPVVSLRSDITFTKGTTGSNGVTDYTINSPDA